MNGFTQQGMASQRVDYLRPEFAGAEKPSFAVDDRIRRECATIKRQWQHQSGLASLAQFDGMSASNDVIRAIQKEQQSSTAVTGAESQWHVG